MKYILAVTLTLVTKTLFAQGAAPFWTPLQGPPAGIPATYLLPNGQLSTSVGGTSYVYLPGMNNWEPFEKKEGIQQPFHGPGPNMASIYFTKDDTIYAVHIDTVYVSNDNGVSWRQLGSYGRPGQYSIRAILELPSSRVAIFNDTNAIYLSSNEFQTADTIHPPEFMFYLFNDADTLFVSTIYGNLYRSSNYGMTWNETANLHDSSRNRLDLIMTYDMWILQSYRLTPPDNYSDEWMGYSFDRGKSWTAMTNPVGPNEQVGIIGMDSTHRLYLLSVSAGSFRSDDSGRTWVHIPLPPKYIMPDGTLYSDSGYTVASPGYQIGLFLKSTDYGETWSRISSSGIQAVPFSMTSAYGQVWISTLDSLYASMDIGGSWSADTANHNYYHSGYLTSLQREGGWWCAASASNGDSNWLLLNTTHIVGEGSDCCNQTAEEDGLGITTSHLNVWLRANPFNLSESADTGCGFVPLNDTLSITPILSILETLNDTILAASTLGIYRGFDAFYPFDTVTPEQTATPTGVMAKDSTGAIYASMSDGKLFVTMDGANSWQSFPSPEMDSAAPIISLAAVPNGLLLAVDSNRMTGLTTTWEYDPSKQTWKNVTYGLRRQGFPDTAEVTNIWYVNGYAYAGTWNLGLFRSVKPVGPVSSVASAEHDSPFHLYPNPASTFVTLTYPSKISGTYRIVDVTGRELQSGSLPPNAGKALIDIHTLPAGLYEITASAGWFPAKLVVQH